MSTTQVLGNIALISIIVASAIVCISIVAEAIHSIMLRRAVIKRMKSYTKHMKEMQRRRFYDVDMHEIKKGKEDGNSN